MSVLLSLYYLTQPKSAYRLFWFLWGLFLIHFIISGVIIFGLKDSIDGLTAYIRAINSYVLIILGIGIMIYSLVPHNSNTNTSDQPSHYYTALPFIMGIISPIIDFPALIEYVVLSVQINFLFERTLYRVMANIGLNIFFHIPIVIFWIIAVIEKQASIAHIQSRLKEFSLKLKTFQPYLGICIGLLFILAGVLLYQNIL